LKVSGDVTMLIYQFHWNWQQWSTCCVRINISYFLIMLYNRIYRNARIHAHFVWVININVCTHVYLSTKFAASYFNEMTKITISNQSHKSYKKYKSENGRTRTSEYIRGGIRCHGGVSFPCWPVTPAVSPISTFDERYDP
jgi:hypothetical protein